MEERSVKITIEQAREWVNSDNETLKTLALSAYSKEELEEETLDSIRNKLQISMMGKYIPTKEKRKAEIHINLVTLAHYFNKGWKKKVGDTGYYLQKVPKCKNTAPSYLNVVTDEDYIIKIFSYNAICEGTVYFKSHFDLLKACKILGEYAIRELFE